MPRDIDGIQRVQTISSVSTASTQYETNHPELGKPVQPTADSTIVYWTFTHTIPATD